MTRGAAFDAVSRAAALSPVPSGRERGPGRSRWFAVVALLMLFSLALRAVNLWSGLPELIGPDEPVVFGRSETILNGSLPHQYDWPTGSMLFLALIRGAFAVSGWVALDDTAAGYRLSRVAFAVLSPVLVLSTVALAHELRTRRRPDARRLAAVAVSGLLVATAYPLVRVGRRLSPDILQALLATTGLWLVVRFDRDRRSVYLVLAAIAGGLAFGAKYLGGLVLLPLGLAILVHSSPLGTKARQFGYAGAAFAAGVVVSLPAAVLRFSEVSEGVAFQLTHQSTGHLGYDAATPAWGFHLFTAIPGAWGPFATAVTLAALGWALLKGGRPQRLVAVFAVAAIAVLGASRVRFPHYVILYLPALAALGGWLLDELAGRIRRPLFWAVALVLAVSLAPTILNDVRLIRAAAAENTREVASDVVVALDGQVVAEAYTDLSGRGERVAAIGNTPRVLDCDGCHVVVSSFQEERFRREPTRYAREVAVYNRLRRRAEVVAVIRPSRPLSYRWELLPEYGIGDLPVVGDPGRVGPRITIFRLSRSA